MNAASLCFLVSAAAYAGFQWTVNVVVYPQFSSVPSQAFVEYERLHRRRITIVVGPLFATLILSAGWLIVDVPEGVPVWLALSAPVLVAALLALTAVAAVPQHRKLSEGWSAAAHRALLRVDLARTLVATAVLGTAIAIALS